MIRIHRSPQLFATLSSKSLSLPSIRVETDDFSDPDAFYKALEVKFSPPKNTFFKDASFLLDYSKISADPESATLLNNEIITKHCQIVRDFGLKPVGVTSVSPNIDNVDVPIFSVSTGDTPQPQPNATNKGSSSKQIPNKPPLVFPNSIRSGATVSPEQGRSVIVLGDVKLGADVESARSIHVLGTLEGKVSAGCLGDQNATISCAGKFKPSFVSIAGHALVGDTIHDDSDSPRLVYLEEGTQKIIVH